MNTKSSPCKYCGEAQHTTEEEKDECGGLCSTKGCVELRMYCDVCDNEKLEKCDAHTEKDERLCCECEDNRFICDSCHEQYDAHADQPRSRITLGPDDDRRTYDVCTHCRGSM